MVDKYSLGSHRSRVKKPRRSLKIPIIAAVIIVVIAAAAIGFYYYELQLQKASEASNSRVGTDIGDHLPNFSFTLLDGTNTTLSNYYNSANHTILLWLVATWSSYTTTGLSSLNSTYYSQLNAKGVIILVVELYNDMGKSGPTLSQLANQYGGAGKSNWFFGTENSNVSTINPRYDIAVFYLLSPNGIIITPGYGSPPFDYMLTKV
jgi:hypothetical protein